MRRRVLFAHYDPANEVRPYVVHHLRALGELGELQFVSNSPLPAGEADKVRPHAARMLLRENAGFDFGAWKEALRGADLSTLDELVLTNSSVVGPLRPLAPIFERMAADGWDFWGMTESFELSHHLQSWFLVLRKPALSSQAFREFVEGILPYRAKDNVVFSYELGLSAYLWQHGFRGGAAFPLDALPPLRWFDSLARGDRLGRLRKDANPTRRYPDLLLEAGMPYVKAEVVRSARWRARIGKAIGGDGLPAA